MSVGPSRIFRHILYRAAPGTALCVVSLLACRADIKPPDPESTPVSRPVPDAGRAPDARVATPDPPPGRDAATSASRDGSTGPDGATSHLDAAIQTPPSACGTQRPDIDGLTNVDGLAIAPDGTIYYTRAGEPEALVGRLEPGGAPASSWVRIPADGARLWGLALDSRRNRLFVAAGGAQAIFQVDLSAEPPAVRPLLEGLMVPNDLAIDSAGNVYFSERGDGKIHRVTPAGARNEVTPTSIGRQNSPGGLAFGLDGALYAGTFNGPIMRIELDGGVERSRAPWGAFSDRANGLAFDARGRLYVGTFSSTDEARLVRIDDSEGDPVEIQSGPHFSSLAFGRGALDCRDLYVAVPSGPMRRIQTDAPGAPATW
jgi:sugar lactone lactonase YvrE